MATKSRLSKSILDMKFMKRTKEKVIKEEDDAEGRAMYLSEMTDKMLTGNSQFIIEPSYVPCENLKDGRISFRGMNPEIERLLELEEQERQSKADVDVKKDVTDTEMSNYYGNVVKTMQRKFEPKVKRKMVLPEPVNTTYKRTKAGGQHQKQGFIKPNTDD
ncbi:M-phase phosphoprotein 6 [Bradysia coprophila]|uniref:M-phase phosphoprotein 6 n=1 Tax=Bradysia coprophila TaxID=38358 RepID=UPI00187D6EB5|nr:M-phase phosphoprotein 6 [Bradysia coprophila]